MKNTCGGCLKYLICNHILGGGLFKTDPACEGYYDKKQYNVKDFVYVIRCKDCEHYNNGFCESIDGLTGAVKKEDYCSKGERKENDNGTTER